MVNIVLASVPRYMVESYESSSRVLIHDPNVSQFQLYTLSVHLPRVMKLRSGGMAPLLAAEAAASLANGLDKQIR